MAQINPEIISKLSEYQNQIWSTVSLTVSEASNQAVNFGSPLTVSARTSDLYSDIGSAMLVIQFAFASMPENAQVVLMPGESFAAFASALKGEQLTDVDDNILADIRPSLEAMVQGICMAVGNIRNEAMVASGLSIRYQVFAFPPNLQRQEELIRTQIAVSGEELSATCLWLMDEETAARFLGMEQSKEDGSDSPFAQMGSASPAAGGGNQAAVHPYEDHSALELLMDIPLEISVELGRVKMLIKDVVELGTGSIIEIDKAAGEPVDVMVNGRLVAKGEVVVIEDNFGVRITEILTPQERLAKLGEAA
jgi:flagellar motor switch protein FliN/FliY